MYRIFFFPIPGKTFGRFMAKKIEKPREGALPSAGIDAKILCTVVRKVGQLTGHSQIFTKEKKKRKKNHAVKNRTRNMGHAQKSLTGYTSIQGQLLLGQASHYF